MIWQLRFHQLITILRYGSNQRPLGKQHQGEKSLCPPLHLLHMFDVPMHMRVYYDPSSLRWVPWLPSHVLLASGLNMAQQHGEPPCCYLWALAVNMLDKCDPRATFDLLTEEEMTGHNSSCRNKQTATCSSMRQLLCLDMGCDSKFLGAVDHEGPGTE